jgi:NADPH2:quinone reductase
VDPAVLNARGSLFLTRPNLAHHLLTREELLWRVGDVMNYVASGIVNVRIAGTYPLSEAATAHRDLEGRKTAGKLLLEVR